MNPFGISQKSYAVILNVLMQYKAIERVIIYGSRAKGNFKEGSDIDLAIVGEDLSPAVAMDIAAILNERKPLPYKIDVIHYESITNKSLKEHIDRVGREFQIQLENL